MTDFDLYSLIALGLLSLADHVTTNIFLKRGVREFNPLLARIIAVWGSTGLFWAKAAVFGVTVWAVHEYGPMEDPRILPGLCIAYVALVAWNLRAIRRAPR